MAEFLQYLVQVSEKAARIARAWKLEDTLFDLLVQEKTGEAKNQRFAQDFKTLADVLIQEVVRHDVTAKFPQLDHHIYGEESNLFTDQHGEAVKIEVQSNKEQTASLLAKLLNQKGDARVAMLLADIVHSNVEQEDYGCKPCSDVTALDLPLENCAIWIDPIDGTGQYVKGKGETRHQGRVITEGLACVTVLIGLFNQNTGEPVAGVVNQPFATYDELAGKWRSNCVWGVSYKEQWSSFGEIKTSENEKTALKVAVSSSECKELKEHLEFCGMKVYAMAGVGYKLLEVINGEVDFYILTKDSSFKWDTCGPHAILRSLGGGTVPYRQAVALAPRFTDDEKLLSALREVELKYNKPDEDNAEPGKKWSNIHGLIAFRSCSSVMRLLRELQKVQKKY